MISQEQAVAAPTSMTDVAMSHMSYPSLFKKRCRHVGPGGLRRLGKCAT